MSSTTSIGNMAVPAVKATRVRYAILGLLFLVTAINYADRATLSIAGTALARELLHAPALAVVTADGGALETEPPRFVCWHCGRAMVVMQTFARDHAIRGPPMEQAR